MQKKTLYKLDEISKYSIYSKLNNNYERILGERSLKSFVKINKKPKIYKSQNILEEIHKRFPNKDPTKEKKDPKEFINNLILKKSEINKTNNSNSNKNKYYKVFNSLPNNNPKKPSIKDFFHSNNKIKNQDVISLDPFKYHPNYDIIFKKVPYVRIGDPKEKNNSREKSSKFKENKKLRQKNYLTSVVPSLDNTDENENIKVNKSFPIKNKNKHISSNSININYSIKLPNINNNRRNDNHALRFSKYGNQRSYNYDNKNEEGEKLRQKNYSNNSFSFDKINMKRIITINFNKMSSRREADFINNYALDNPSFNRYSPKYDFVKANPVKISFSYHYLDNNDINKKKYLLKKLMASYNDVDSDYHIVNNEQIKNSASSNSIDQNK